MRPKFTVEGTRLEPSFLKHLAHRLSTIKAKNSRPLGFSGSLYLSNCLFLSCPPRPTPQHLCQLYLLRLSLYLSITQYSSSLYRLWAKKGKVLFLLVVALQHPYCKTYKKSARAMTLQFHTFYHKS